MSTRWNTICSHALLAWAVITVLGTSLSHATVLRKLSLDELVAYADTIMVGKCEKTETVWLARKIYTIATICVSQHVRGKAAVGSTIKVYILGGRVKKPIPVKMHVPGAAKVAQGEEMLLFLKAGGIKKQYHRFVGMTQGKIPVKTDPRTGEKFIHYGEPIKGVKFVDEQGKPLAQGGRPEPAKPGSLEAFLGRVKQIMADQEAKAKKAAQQKVSIRIPGKRRKGV